MECVQSSHLHWRLMTTVNNLKEEEEEKEETEITRQLQSCGHTAIITQQLLRKADVVMSLYRGSKEVQHQKVV